MFKSKEENIELLQTINKLKEENDTLKKHLNEVANNTGNCIIKQMPNGSMELNGIPFDNTSDVDYYNSAKATFSELTMFRVGKETKQREMDKLIKIHMEEVDKLKQQIESLLYNNSKLSSDITEKEHAIIQLKNTITDKELQLTKLNKLLDSIKEQSELTLKETINRYDNCINHLNNDIDNWRKRYLTINNTMIDGTIITKYGKVLNNDNEGDINNE